MKTALRIALGLALASLTGCEMKKTPEGLRVEIRPEAAATLKKELMPLLVAKGFRSANENGSYFAVYFLAQPPAYTPTLYAFFLRSGADHSFLIGKVTTDFTHSEVAIIDECAAIIASHADFIISGSVVKAATTPTSRERFYAKIKKP